MSRALFALVVVGLTACPKTTAPPAKTTPDEVVAAAPDAKPANPLCEPLAQMIDAGADGSFTSLQGGRGTLTDSFISTLMLPGAVACEIFRDSPNEPAWLACEYESTMDQAEIAEQRARFRDQLRDCLPADAWTIEEGPIYVNWTRPGEIWPTVGLHFIDNYGVYNLDIEVNGRHPDE